MYRQYSKGSTSRRAQKYRRCFRGAVLDDETNQVSGQAELFEDRDEDDENHIQILASADAVTYLRQEADGSSGFSLSCGNPMSELRSPSLQARLHSLRKESKRF